MHRVSDSQNTPTSSPPLFVAQITSTIRITAIEAASHKGVSAIEVSPNQAELISSGAFMRGWHRIRLDELLKQIYENKKLLELVIHHNILTADKDVRQEGPCKILDNGLLRLLIDSQGNSFEDTSPEGRQDILKEYYALEKANKAAWAHNGKGTVFVKAIHSEDIYRLSGGVGGLRIDAGADKGVAVWVKNEPEPDVKRHGGKLLRTHTNNLRR